MISDTVLLTLGACTADDGGALTYTTSDSKFSIDSTTRVITSTATTLDFETNPQYIFDVVVQDSGPNVGSTTIKIVVDVSIYLNG